MKNYSEKNTVVTLTLRGLNIPIFLIGCVAIVVLIVANRGLRQDVKDLRSIIDNTWSVKSNALLVTNLSWRSTETNYIRFPAAAQREEK